MLQPMGLIIGHGYVKAVSMRGSFQFPSLAAPAPANDYMSLAGGPSLIRVDGTSEWVVGHDARMFASKRIVSILDRSRYASPSFIALAKAAVEQATTPYDNLFIRTGMPATWFSDHSARNALESALRKAVGSRDVTIRIAPEAAGVFYAWVFESGRLDTNRIKGPIGVIDVGYRDFNIALFDSGRYVGGTSQPGGIVQALNEIQRLISREYQLELTCHDVDSAVKSGTIMVNGRPCALPAETHGRIGAVIDPIISAGRALWPSGGRGLQALVLGGGGAEFIASALHEAFPHVVQPSCATSQMAGAWGFAQVAAAEIQQGRK